MPAEWFHFREIYSSGLTADGYALYKIKESVRIRVIVVVQFVHTHGAKQDLAIDSTLGNVVGACSGLNVVVDHIQSEIFAGKLIGAYVIDVLHHQVPHRQLRIGHRAFEHLEVKRLISGNTVRGEFSHLKHLSTVGILVGHGKNLVRLQFPVQRYITQLWMDAIFGLAQFRGEFKGLIVLRVDEIVGRCQR